MAVVNVNDTFPVSSVSKGVWFTTLFFSSSYTFTNINSSVFENILQGIGDNYELCKKK